jgi:hypothetical protein
MLSTIAEIDSALAQMPASPELPDDIRKRADLMRARFAALEQVETERRRAAAFPPLHLFPHRPPLVTLAAPDNITHVEIAGTKPRVIKQTVTRGRVQAVEETVTNEPVRIAVEVIDGHRYVFLTPHDALRMLNSDQGAWRALNGDPGNHPHFPSTMFYENNGAPL